MQISYIINLSEIDLRILIVHVTAILLCTHNILDQLCWQFYNPSVWQIIQCVSEIPSAAIKRLCVKLTTHLRLVYIENDNNFHSQILKLLRIVQKNLCSCYHPRN